MEFSAASNLAICDATQILCPHLLGVLHFDRFVEIVPRVMQSDLFVETQLPTVIKPLALFVEKLPYLFDTIAIVCGETTILTNH